MRKAKIIFNSAMLTIMIAFGVYLWRSAMVAPLSDIEWVKISFIYTSAFAAIAVVNTKFKD